MSSPTALSSVSNHAPAGRAPESSASDAGEPVDELGETPGEVDVGARHVVHRQHRSEEAVVLLRHGDAEQQPVQRRGPGALDDATELEARPPRGVLSPADAGLERPRAHAVEVLVAEPEPTPHRGLAREVDHRRRRDARVRELQQRRQGGQDGVGAGRRAVGDLHAQRPPGVGLHVGRRADRPEHRLHQRGERLDVGAHHDDVPRLQRRVVGEQTEQRVAQHLDLPGAAVAGVDLDGPVGGWRRRAGVVRAEREPAGRRARSSREPAPAPSRPRAAGGAGASRAPWRWTPSTRASDGAPSPDARCDAPDRVRPSPRGRATGAGATGGRRGAPPGHRARGREPRAGRSRRTPRVAAGSRRGRGSGRAGRPRRPSAPPAQACRGADAASATARPPSAGRRAGACRRRPRRAPAPRRARARAAARRTTRAARPGAARAGTGGCDAPRRPWCRGAGPPSRATARPAPRRGPRARATGAGRGARGRRRPRGRAWRRASSRRAPGAGRSGRSRRCRRPRRRLRPSPGGGRGAGRPTAPHRASGRRRRRGRTGRPVRRPGRPPGRPRGRRRAPPRAAAGGLRCLLRRPPSDRRPARASSTVVVNRGFGERVQARTTRLAPTGSGREGATP